MRTHHFIVAVLIGSAAASIACGRETDTNKQDPNRPAVVQLPPPVLASDTAHPDTMEAYRERINQLRPRMAGFYALLGTAATFGDRRVVASFFAPDATFSLGDTTFTGVVVIANGLVDLIRRNSIKEIVRASRALNATDSVAVDSGLYGIRAQRDGGKQTEQRGTYVSSWKRKPGNDPDWVLVRDVLTPALPAKKR